MAQITTDTIASMLEYAKRGERYPLTLNEIQQLAYLALAAMTVQTQPRRDDTRHKFKPHPKHPSFCDVCGYYATEPLQHFQAT